MSKNIIVIRRPINSGLDFIASIQRICEKNGWRHVEQRTQDEYTYHYFEEL